MRPEAVHALKTRERQVARELERQASEIFHVGELVYALHYAPYPYRGGRVYSVEQTNGQWLLLKDTETRETHGRSPGVGSSYFLLVGECAAHRGAWRADDDGGKLTNGNLVGWHYCSRCGVVLPEWPNRYWMTHDNSHLPLPNPDVGDTHVPPERSARPRAAA